MTTQAEFDKLEIAAKEAGNNYGIAAASWYEINDGNAARIIKGIDEGDPEVYDSFPSAPLSGEWAGDPTSASVLEEINAPKSLDDSERDALLTAYEDAFLQAVQDEIERRARYYLEDED